MGAGGPAGPRGLRRVASDPHALPQVLAGALAVALSGRCDRDVLRLLLVLPEGQASGSAVRELCGLPGAQAFALMVSVTRNLDPRAFVYKVSGAQPGWLG